MQISLRPINAQLTRMENRMTGLETRMTGLETRMSAQEVEIQNSRAFCYNSSAIVGTEGMQDILPLRDALGNLPPEFPTTKDALHSLDLASINTLLDFYGRPRTRQARIETQRKILKKYLGIRG